MAAKEPLKEWSFSHRQVGEKDILIDIEYCGVCHSDIHQVKDDWGKGFYPMVPGHEIVGTVSKVGTSVKKYRVGDTVGVGCLVDSCKDCDNCKNNEEQFCMNGITWTYNAYSRDGKTLNQGGYSKQIVVNEDFVLKVSNKLDKKRVAPLLCAGITTYSPLKHWKVGKDTKVGILGLGGLGHMGVKFAVAMGAEVTVLSTSSNKEKDAENLGAHHFINTKTHDLGKLNNYFDFILNTVSAPINLDIYANMLRLNGAMVMVGIAPTPLQISAFSLVTGRRTLSGSLIGGIKETQEMLDFCEKHNILSDVEVIDISYINEAFERVIKGDVHYRFVIDISKF